mgnify:CR=1 FL=1
MANEIKITAGMTCTNGNLSVQVPASTIQVDQATAKGGGPASVDVGTTEETIGFGDITARYVFMKNLDAANFVQIGFSTGVYGIKLLSGETAVFPLLTSATVYAKADTATCTLQVIGLNL